MSTIVNITKKRGLKPRSEVRVASSERTYGSNQCKGNIFNSTHKQNEHLFNFLAQSNRYKHLIGGFFVLHSSFFTYLLVAFDANAPTTLAHQL